MAGAVEVDKFLNTIDPKLFKRWRAYFRVRDAEAWHIAARIAKAAWNAAILASGASGPDGESLLRDDESFIPPDKRIQRRQRQPVEREPEEVDTREIMAARYPNAR